MQRPGDSRRLLLVGARAETAAKARAAGFRVWRLPDSASGHPADPAAEVRSLTHRHRIGRVLHTGEGRARLAALEDADATGLALTSARSVRRLTDPVALRRLLREDGRFAARSRETASADQAAEAVRETGLPAVVRRCGSPDGRTALLTEPGDLTAWRAATRDEDGPFLVEEFVEGPLFVVYALTVDGLHHMLAVTNRRSAGALVTEVCPAPVGNRQVAELRSAAERAARPCRLPVRPRPRHAGARRGRAPHRGVRHRHRPPRRRTPAGGGRFRPGDLAVPRARRGAGHPPGALAHGHHRPPPPAPAVPGDGSLRTGRPRARRRPAPPPHPARPDGPRTPQHPGGDA
ncbi:hypothetical protein R2F25_18825 [Streptomyces sp. UP1A-1]|nr:hypothetical protein [Streptomyces sp. UP1A-1]